MHLHGQRPGVCVLAALETLVIGHGLSLVQLAATFAVLVADVPASAVALDQVVELLYEVVDDQIRLLGSAQHSCVPVFAVCFNLAQAR